MKLAATQFAMSACPRAALPSATRPTDVPRVDVVNRPGMSGDSPGRFNINTCSANPADSALKITDQIAANVTARW